MGVIEQAQVESVLRPLDGADPCGPDLTETPLPPAPGQPDLTVRRFWTTSDPVKAFVDTEVQVDNKFKIQKIRPPIWADTTFRGAVRVFTATKDLRAMMRLVQSAMVTGGLEGLAEGLELLLQFVLRYWDGFHPRPGADGGQDERLAMLDQISGASEDWNGLALLPGNPRATFGGLGLSGTKPSTVVLEELDSASLADLQETLFWIRSCRRSLLTLKTFWRVQVPKGRSFDPDTCRPSAPAFSPGPMLKRAEEVVSEALAGRGATGGAVVPIRPGTTTSPTPQSDMNGLTLTKREDVVRAIDAICDFYKEHDVASPVPIMMRRCQRLVTANFEQILGDLLTDQLAAFRKSYVGPPKT